MLSVPLGGWNMFAVAGCLTRSLHGNNVTADAVMDTQTKRVVGCSQDDAGKHSTSQVDGKMSRVVRREGCLLHGRQRQRGSEIQAGREVKWKAEVKRRLEW